MESRKAPFGEKEKKPTQNLCLMGSGGEMGVGEEGGKEEEEIQPALVAS